jgi:hypothetical protein
VRLSVFLSDRYYLNFSNNTRLKRKKERKKRAQQVLGCILLTHQAHQTVMYWPIKPIKLPYGCPNLTPGTQLDTTSAISMEKHGDGWMEELEVTGSSTRKHMMRGRTFFAQIW